MIDEPHDRRRPGGFLDSFPGGPDARIAGSGGKRVDQMRELLAVRPGQSADDRRLACDDGLDAPPGLKSHVVDGAEVQGIDHREPQALGGDRQGEHPPVASQGRPNQCARGGLRIEGGRRVRKPQLAREGARDQLAVGEPAPDQDLTESATTSPLFVECGRQCVRGDGAPIQEEASKDCGAGGHAGDSTHR